jgi:hypothetical protein
MTPHLRSALALLALLTPALAAAKPPDLPLDQQDTVGPPPAAVPAPLVGPLLLGVHPLLPAAPAADGPALTCPYLRQRPQPPAPAMSRAPEVAEVLDNLQRLEQAEDLYAIATALLREGHAWEAVICCEVVCQLAPGSRCAQEANRLVADALVSYAGSSGAAEEQESTGTEPGVAEQVAGLLKACRLAVGAGDRRHAGELARQVHALAPARALADPVVRGLLRQRTKPAASGTPMKPDRDSCPYCPGPQGPMMLRSPQAGPTDGRDMVVRCSSSCGEMELGLEYPGAGIHLGCDLRCGPRVYHILFAHGTLAAWTSADTSALPPPFGRQP